MLDFAALPPEVNSGRMYAGPGAGPMLAAAAGWDELAVELESAAAGYSSAISGLTAQVWSGPASAAMSAAAAPYVAWLQATAAQAEQTAAQAKAAAAAYEAAFALTVPPPEIAANRALLTALVATNFFGQNTPAIAATEAHYAEMWAQDATAMYQYAGSSATASTLAPFREPPSTTSPGGPGAQTATVAQAAASAAGTHTDALAQLTSSLPGALQPLGPTGAMTGSTGSTASSGIISWTTLFGSQPIFGIKGLLGPTVFGQTGTTYMFHAVKAGYTANSQVNQGTRIMNSGVNWARQSEKAARFAEQQAARAAGLAGGLGPTGPISAGVGRAAAVGSLSVPPTWAGDPVVIRPAALALPNVSAAAGAVPVPAVPPSGTTFSQALLCALSKDGADPAHPKSKPVIVRNPASEGRTV